MKFISNIVIILINTKSYFIIFATSVVGEGPSMAGGREASLELEESCAEIKGRRDKFEKEKAKERLKAEKEKEGEDGKLF